MHLMVDLTLTAFPKTASSGGAVSLAPDRRSNVLAIFSFKLFFGLISQPFIDSSWEAY